MLRKIALFGAAACLMFSLAACGGGNDAANADAVESTNESNAAELRITAENFAFDQQEYRISAGEPINFALENTSGYHTVEIKGLGIKIEPGKVSQYKITKPGTYDMVCGTYCGSGHGKMTAKLIVE
jgi:Heme/copper-type cytochrome/quinol oxidases, subunit 2